MVIALSGSGKSIERDLRGIETLRASDISITGRI
jgi:hypothetical protein